MERRLEATATVRALFENASRLLSRDPAQVLSSGATAQARRSRRFPLEMTTVLGGGSTVVQTVVAELGSPKVSPDAVAFPLMWTPTGHTHVVPSFHGSLSLALEGFHTRLTLEGRYRPPWGPVGAFGDAVIGHRIARQTVTAFLATVARRIDEVIDRQMEEGFRPPPRPDDLRAVPMPENWLG